MTLQAKLIKTLVFAVVPQDQMQLKLGLESFTLFCASEFTKEEEGRAKSRAPPKAVLIKARSRNKFPRPSGTRTHILQVGFLVVSQFSGCLYCKYILVKSRDSNSSDVL